MPPPTAKNWNAISPSRFPWEQEALDFIHEKFPASPEYLAWSNFEFIAADGSINETDLLIASPWGVFFIEIKSRPGRLTGDNASWTWVGEDGYRRVDDNPLRLANLKTKRLKDLLGRQSAFRNREVPFIQALIFCSAPGLDFQLAPDARTFICVRDNEDKSRPGIRAAVFQREGAGLRQFWERPVDGPKLKAFAQAMAQAGLRGQHRKVADFILDRLRYESPTGVYQDWEAHHSTSESVRRLVRLYLTSNQAAKEDRRAIVDASKREFHTLEKLNHPSILKALVPAESELGPAIVFEFDPTAQRLDLLSPSYSIGSRRHTRFTHDPSAVTDPEIAEAANIENRLRHSMTEGGYLILTVDPSQLESARKELTQRFDLDACDLDDLFLENLRAEADRVGASWDVVLAADAKPHDSTDWTNLQRLVERALPGIEGRLRSAKKTCLALHPGLLARYGHMNIIGGLAADVGRAGGPRGLWVLSPDNGQHTLPTLDGAPIPITNNAQHTRLTSAWLRNEHRSAGLAQS